MRPPNRPDFMYEKPSRIEGMCENHRLMGFPTHACRALVLVLSSYAYQEIVSLLLAGWELPEEFATLRRLIEARMGKRGKREFVQVLRLLEVFRAEDVLAGVREAIVRGAIGFDAIKHLVLCRIEHRPPRLDPGSSPGQALTVYPYL